MSDLFGRVKEIPLASVIRDYFPSVELKRDGGDLVGARCPLHEESTPSFKVYVEQNRWHCFGACNAGGSSIDLLIRAGLASTPLEAAKALATKFGIDIRDNKRQLLVSQYADFCALPDSFLRQTFDLRNSDSGIEIPYKNESGEVVSVQRRHKLEKGKKKDGRFSWRKGDKPIPYGLWLLPETKTRLVLVEGPSDVHVLTHCGVVALGIPGASSFKPAMASSLLPFAELALIQEPGLGGEKFIESITKALKDAEYKGIVRAVSLPEKDPRALWLKSRDKVQFTAALDQAIAAAAPIDLYPPIPLTKELIKELSALIRRFIFFKNERVPLLVATWILTTYVHDRFQYMPILWITSPVMRCGKSRLVDILDRLVWNSSGSVINTSAAALYYMTAEGCTFLADEVENLKNSDREQFGTIIGIINAGFAKGATVRRMVQIEGEWVQKKFPVYGPKVLSGIATVSDTIRDRSLPIRMIRKSRKEKVIRFNMRREGQRLGEIAASMALWAGENGEMIEKIYDDLPDQPELAGCDDRFLDIIDPILSVVKFADAESANGGNRIIDELMPLLKDLGGQRGESQSDEAVVALLGLLEIILDGSAKMFITSADLHERMKGTSGLQWIGSTKAMATFLSKFDLVSRHNPGGKKRGYEITKGTLEDLKLRYTPTLPDFDPSDPSQTRAQSGFGGDL
jgi:CHC2 zinc finger